MPPMIVSLNLSPEEAEALDRYAGAGGVDIETFLHRLIALLVEHPGHEAEEAAARPQAPGLTHPQRGPGDGGADDPEGQAEEERDRAEMRDNIRRWREEQGRL